MGEETGDTVPEFRPPPVRQQSHVNIPEHQHTIKEEITLTLQDNNPKQSTKQPNDTKNEGSIFLQLTSRFRW